MADATNAVSRLTRKLASTRGLVIVSQNSAGLSFAVYITSDASGISTTILNMEIVTPRDNPNPGITRLLFFLIPAPYFS